MLTQLQTIPYELELRDTVNAALYTFGNLVAAGEEVIRAQDAANAAPPGEADLRLLQVRAQTHLFDTLEAFLTAFARVSLLVFPVSKAPFAVERGLTMQHCLGLTDKSPLNDRQLRDSWMHHDERIDKACEMRFGAAAQTFSRSGGPIARETDTFLRVIEADTLVIHYRDRDGNKQARDLHEIAKTLKEVDAVRIVGFRVLAL